MGTKDSVEFKNALRDIAQYAHHLNSPFGNNIFIFKFVLGKHNAKF